MKDRMFDGECQDCSFGSVEKIQDHEPQVYCSLGGIRDLDAGCNIVTTTPRLSRYIANREKSLTAEHRMVLGLTSPAAMEFIQSLWIGQYKRELLNDIMILLKALKGHGPSERENMRIEQLTVALREII